MPVINEKLQKELSVQTDLMDEPEKLRVITKLTHPSVEWAWYLICFNDNHKRHDIYTLLDGPDIEYGVIGLEEINKNKINGMPFEIDDTFKPCNAKELFEKLSKKESLPLSTYY